MANVDRLLSQFLHPVAEAPGDEVVGERRAAIMVESAVWHLDKALRENARGLCASDGRLRAEAHDESQDLVQDVWVAFLLRTAKARVAVIRARFKDGEHLSNSLRVSLRNRFLSLRACAAVARSAPLEAVPARREAMPAPPLPGYVMSDTWGHVPAAPELLAEAIRERARIEARPDPRERHTVKRNVSLVHSRLRGLAEGYEVDLGALASAHGMSKSRGSQTWERYRRRLQQPLRRAAAG